MARPGRDLLPAFLRRLGVDEPGPVTVPFDPGYDPLTLEAHLEQSAHLMAMLKLSMACWMIASERATKRKIAAARSHRVPVVTGGGPFEIAAAKGVLEPYLDLCAGLGVTRVEAGEGFTDLPVGPADAVRMARERGLELQFELGKKHTGAFTDDGVGQLIDQGARWLDAGARQLVVEARESASDVGLFSADGTLDTGLAERFADAFGLQTVIFEAPTKPSQFALMDRFGPEVLLTNVRLEEVLRVEIYRRALHSDAFGQRHVHTSAAAPRLG
jgi:phosphosulfolactate synthase